MFTLVASVSGADATGDTTLVDTLPDGVVPLEVEPAYNQNSGEGCLISELQQEIQCLWPTWAAGTNRTVNILVEALFARRYLNNATLYSPGAQDATATATVTVQASASGS